MYQLYNDVLDSIEMKYIDNVILTTTLPWYFNQNTIDNNRINYNDNRVFTHVLLNRYEATKSLEIESRITSEYFQFFMNIFKNFCVKNGIKFKNIFRMSLNLTFNEPNEYGVVHVDHNFEHKNFILYLNDFSKGSTFIFEDEKIIEEIPARKNRAVIFDGLKHAQGFCLQGEHRYILVVTFL